jgi:hypothetical protein
MNNPAPAAVPLAIDERLENTPADTDSIWMDGSLLMMFSSFDCEFGSA